MNVQNTGSKQFVAHISGLMGNGEGGFRLSTRAARARGSALAQTQLFVLTLLVGVSGAALGIVLAGYPETLQRGQAISQNPQAQGAGPVPVLAPAAGPISPVRRPERVVEQARASVCLIQGSYVFRDKESGKPLRRAEWILDGGDVVLEDSFSATGFLISPDGKILTNRHVAQPWWENRDAEQIISKGYRPELTSLVAYFPGCRTPYGLKPVRISPNADLALLQTRGVRNLPAPLLLRTEAVAPGDQVLLIGYPAGLSPVLRRSVQARLERIPGHLNFTDQQISRQLAQWKLIEPFVSVGCVSNVGAEVVTLSALTSDGSSGSPVLDQQGRVLAIAFASLTQVAGGSLAVPARLAADLIGDPGERRRMPPSTSDANSSWRPPRLPGWKRRSSFANLCRTISNADMSRHLPTPRAEAPSRRQCNETTCNGNRRAHATVGGNGYGTRITRYREGGCPSSRTITRQWRERTQSRIDDPGIRVRVRRLRTRSRSIAAHAEIGFNSPAADTSACWRETRRGRTLGYVRWIAVPQRIWSFAGEGD